MWTNFHLGIEVNRLVAGIPANPNLLGAWLATNKAHPDAVNQQLEHQDKLAPELTHGVIFYRDPDGQPMFETRCLKAAFKEAANVCKDLLEIPNFRARLAERVFVDDPNLIPITSPIKKAQRPISVMTRLGPRTSIKEFEYAEKVRLVFNVWLLQKSGIEGDDLEVLLSYLEKAGIGSDRSQGNGSFQIQAWKMISETTQDPAAAKLAAKVAAAG